MADGTFESKLQEMYDWGKVHGWEPVVSSRVHTRTHALALTTHRLLP